MPQRFPLTIEILGPSGSGKSTILRHAQDALAQAGWLTPQDLTDKPASLGSVLYHDRPLDDLAWRPLVRWCLEFAAQAPWAPSQAAGAVAILAQSCREAARLRGRADPQPILHDELLLHCAFSFLPRSEAWLDDTDRFFDLVPLPAAAVVVSADAATNRTRLTHRGHTNITRDLDDQDLVLITERSENIARRAADRLRNRGIAVLELDSRNPVEACAQTLVTFVRNVQATAERESPQNFIRRRIIEVSGSFQARGRRHTMRTQGVAYGSFSTPSFTLSAVDAQRNTTQRLVQFGIEPGVLTDRTVLDIGCHTGAVLFELTGHGIRSGLGLEIDADKVALAYEIRNVLGLMQLQFDVCDIDTLSLKTLPAFDITFALAIEKHLNDQERLYRLLAAVTRERLYFEANGGTDLSAVESALARYGFNDMERRGLSIDDRDPRNHNRQLLVARRRPA